MTRDQDRESLSEREDEQGRVCIVFDEQSEQDLHIERQFSSKLREGGLNPVSFYADGCAGPEVIQRSQLIASATWVVIFCSKIFICDGMFQFQENVSIFTAINKRLINILYILPANLNKTIAKSFPYICMSNKDNWMIAAENILKQRPANLGQSAFISLSNEMTISNISPLSLKSLAQLTKQLTDQTCCRQGTSDQDKISIVWAIKDGDHKAMLTHRWRGDSPVLLPERNGQNPNELENGNTGSLDSANIGKLQNIQVDVKHTKLLNAIKAVLLVLILSYILTTITLLEIVAGPLYDKDYNSTSDLQNPLTITYLSMESVIFLYVLGWSFARLNFEAKVVSSFQLGMNTFALLLYILVCYGYEIFPDIENHIVSGAMAYVSRTASLSSFIILCQRESLRRQTFLKIVCFSPAFLFYLLQFQSTPLVLKQRGVPASSALRFILYMMFAYAATLWCFYDFIGFALEQLKRRRYITDRMFFQYFRVVMIIQIVFFSFLPMTQFLY